MSCLRSPRFWLGLCSDRQDVSLADDAAVLELEDRVGEDLAAARELARDRGGGAVSVRDQVFSTVALTPAAAQCSNIPLKTSLPCRTRGELGGLSRSIWIELDVIGVELEQGLDVPLLVGALESLDVERRCVS